MKGHMSSSISLKQQERSVEGPVVGFQRPKEGYKTREDHFKHAKKKKGRKSIKTEKNSKANELVEKYQFRFLLLRGGNCFLENFFAWLFFLPHVNLYRSTNSIENLASAKRVIFGQMELLRQLQTCPALTHFLISLRFV